jgi:hypothetical protein
VPLEVSPLLCTLFQRDNSFLARGWTKNQVIARGKFPQTFSPMTQENSQRALKMGKACGKSLEFGWNSGQQLALKMHPT